MLSIQENISLRPYNTFGIEAKARYFAEINQLTDVQIALELMNPQNIPLLILGGGSNVLFTKDFEGLVLKMNMRGVEIINENTEHVWLKVGAGEGWHNFVKYCLSNNYGGVENLSLIPGTVGASPMQNIGAYGVELKEVFEELEAFHLQTLEIHRFNNSQCEFGYRESIFKREEKGNYLILSVTFKLSKNPCLNLSYGAIQEVLDEMQVANPTIQDVSKAIVQIRSSKLPNPAEIGNAGSFFKNPTIPTNQFQELLEKFPQMPSYPTENAVKIPAGWLIEQAGWKGYRNADAGVHTKQALVLVNYGNAKGLEIKKLSKKIQESVQEKFGILLSTEVNFV
jgi:UDP-N-acetylmuramate dehydrogenase